MRILVVEDDPGIALALKDDLELEGYVVEVVADARHERGAVVAIAHAGQLHDVLKAVPLQNGGPRLAADAVVAINHRQGARRREDVLHTRRQFAQRDEQAAGEGRQFVLPGLAHIEEED